MNSETPEPREVVPADFARRLELRNRRLMEALHSITQDNDHLSIRCSENEYDDACPKCRAQAALDQHTARIVEEATRVTPSEDVALGNMATGADPLLQLERAIGIGDRQAHIEDIERYQVEIAALKTRAEKAETEVTALNNLLRRAGWGQGEIDSSATLAEELGKAEAEVAELKKWKQEDPRMLREQIRVADAAFQSLHERHDQLQQDVRPFINLAKGKCTCGGWSSTEHSDQCISKQLETFLAEHPELK